MWHPFLHPSCPGGAGVGGRLEHLGVGGELDEGSLAGRHWAKLSASCASQEHPAMDPSSQIQDAQPPPAEPTPLMSYRWHTGDRGAGSSRWARLAGWGRALSHQEPMVSSQPAPRSLFRRVLSAPPKESRTSRLRLSKTLWGKQKNPPQPPPPLEPDTPGRWLPPSP